MYDLKFIFMLMLGVFTLGRTSAQSQMLLNVNDFEKKLEITKDKIVLDVRTKDEFSQGHLANATMIDYYKDDFKEALSKLDKTKPVFVYCAAGGRSSSASGILIELGFKNVYDLHGGMRAWAGAKKPVIK